MTARQLASWARRRGECSIEHGSTETDGSCEGQKVPELSLESGKLAGQGLVRDRTGTPAGQERDGLWTGSGHGEAPFG